MSCDRVKICVREGKGRTDQSHWTWSRRDWTFYEVQNPGDPTPKTDVTVGRTTVINSYWGSGVGTGDEWCRVGTVGRGGRVHGRETLQGMKEDETRSDRVRVGLESDSQ